MHYVWKTLDAMCLKHDVWKLEHVLSDYVIAAGCPFRDKTEQQVKVARALVEMGNFISKFRVGGSTKPLSFKAGAHTGHVAAGIIGASAKRYCFFGDAMNVASRMKSTGTKNMIQVSDAFYTAAMATKAKSKAMELICFE